MSFDATAIYCLNAIICQSALLDLGLLTDPCRCQLRAEITENKTQKGWKHQMGLRYFYGQFLPKMWNPYWVS